MLHVTVIYNLPDCWNTSLICINNNNYRNDRTFLERQAWANSADPDQTAPRGAVWSGSTQFATPSASFGCII